MRGYSLSPPLARMQTHGNHSCVRGTLGNWGKGAGLETETHLMFFPVDNYNQHRMGVCELCKVWEVT